MEKTSKIILILISSIIFVGILSCSSGASTKSAKAGKAQQDNSSGTVEGNAKIAQQRDSATIAMEYSDLYDKAVALLDSNKMDAAIPILDSLSTCNFDKAKSALAELYLEGIGVPKDEEKALALALEASKNNDPAALYLLYTIYRKGMSVPKDMEKANSYLIQSCDQGYERAMLAMARACNSGDGFRIDHPKALSILRNLADKGNAEALLDLGQMYENGTGVEKSIDRAIEFYRRAAANGSDSAGEVLKAKGIE